MAHTSLSHRRTHNLLLISKLLNQRDAASPFTLVLDSLEQTAQPLVREYLRRATAAKTYTIFLAFETVRAPQGVDCFVRCWDKTPAEIARAVGLALSSSGSKRHHLLIIDSLHALCTLSLQPPTDSGGGFNLTQFLSSLITPPPPPPPSSQTSTSPSPSTSLVAIYHTDIPLSHPQSQSQYNPSPLSLLTYLATTLLTTHSLATLLSASEAHSRSLAPPLYGLSSTKEGILIGLKPARFTSHLPQSQRGVVLELEHRRKSGRGVKEWYFLPVGKSKQGLKEKEKETAVVLLDDHPLFKAARSSTEEIGSAGAGDDLAGLTFELGLTERQRAEREGVVLPYFDAQRDGGATGPGDGGRILYDLGVEDDFDEEEDEI